jgi:DNA replication licensing factor MCM5
MDSRSVYTTQTFGSTFDDSSDTRIEIQMQLEAFILGFRIDNNFIYRDQLKDNALLHKFYCDVSVTDLIAYNEDLAHKLLTEPAEIIPLVSL